MILWFIRKKDDFKTTGLHRRTILLKMATNTMRAIHLTLQPNVTCMRKFRKESSLSTFRNRINDFFILNEVICHGVDKHKCVFQVVFALIQHDMLNNLLMLRGKLDSDRLNIYSFMKIPRNYKNITSDSC